MVGAAAGGVMLLLQEEGLLLTFLAVVLCRSWAVPGVSLGPG